MYNPKEITARMDMLIQKLNGILLMLKATGKLQADNHEKLTAAIARDDLDEVIECMKRLESIDRQLQFEKRLYRDAVEDGRRVFVAAYGPAGGLWYDNMIDSIGSV